MIPWYARHLTGIFLPTKRDVTRNMPEPLRRALDKPKHWGKAKEKEEEMKWTTRNGIKIPISKMTTGHIVNTIKMLERDKRQDHECYSLLKEELSKRINFCPKCGRDLWNSLPGLKYCPIDKIWINLQTYERYIAVPKSLLRQIFDLIRTGEWIGYTNKLISGG